ncbi:MAG: tyrosine-type recombinase/integrase [Propionibacteriaceae bacterium]|jgi:site-specific recombinase XerD|nr:tyrosine-type recombinase/integrase [Propionibacteriaceae bacterium]
MRAITLAEAAERYVADLERRADAGLLSARTARMSRDDMADLVTLIGGERIVDDVTGRDVDDALIAFAKLPDRRFTRRDAPAKPRSMASRERFYKSVSAFFSYSVEQGWAAMSPMRWVTMKVRAVDKKKEGLADNRRALTGAQALALLEHGAGSPSPDAENFNTNYRRDRLMIALLEVLGPRISEMTSANVDSIARDVDTDGNLQAWWTVNGKRGQRRVPLSPWLLSLVDEYLPVRAQIVREAKSEERALFVSVRGNRLNPIDVERVIDRAYKRVLQTDPDNARRLTPHALRHTAATIMLSSGWSVKVVKDLLGHANISTTSLYLDDLPGELVEAVRLNPVAERAAKADS